MSTNADEVKGTIKEKAGALIGDDDLQADGKTDKNAGKAKGFLNNLEDKAEDVVDKVKDALHRKD